ncbi:YlaF family protein [Neobacillus kokaensis]|nr:YlaF family protein [Neobacillus kokaensis]
MMQIKWSLLLYAILAAVSIMGIGVAIAEKSLIGIAGCIIVLIAIMGMGFKTKKKLRERGEL